MNKQDFLNTVAPLVQGVNAEYGNKLFNSVVIAQAILESGWGTSSIMMKANAIFGIKAGGNWGGKVYSARTKECYDGINYTTITDLFRAYNSLEEGIRDYFELITKSSRYSNALNQDTPLNCITAIKNGGYATSPTYINSIMTLINQNDLTQYDEEIEEGETPEHPYQIGQVYTIQVDLRVRAGAGTDYRQLKYSELTTDGKNHAYKQDRAVLKKGTKVTCKDIIIHDNEIWLKIPSGYVAGFYDNEFYIL